MTVVYKKENNSRRTISISKTILYLHDLDDQNHVLLVINNAFSETHDLHNLGKQPTTNNVELYMSDQNLIHWVIQVRCTSG